MIVFSRVASFHKVLQVSYIARSVVSRVCFVASVISCLPRLVVSGRSAEASRRYFILFLDPL